MFRRRIETNINIANDSDNVEHCYKVHQRIRFKMPDIPLERITDNALCIKPETNTFVYRPDN